MKSPVYKIYILSAALFLAVSLCAGLSGCTSSLVDDVEAARTKIKSHLNSLGLYEYGNVPESVSESDIKGYYYITAGAFFYTRENDGTADGTIAEWGDDVAIMFDARIFSSSYDYSNTFYTNIETRKNTIRGENEEFDMSLWPSDPIESRLGSGEWLKGMEDALYNQETGNIVRVFLTPDIAYGKKQFGNIPGRSTLVVEMTLSSITKN